MVGRPQKKVSPIWHSDIPGMLIFLLPTIIAVLVGMVLPLFQSLKRVDAWRLFSIGVAAGVAGIVLLFWARLPLYRQQQYFRFGPRLLDAAHRRMYWIA